MTGCGGAPADVLGVVLRAIERRALWIGLPHTKGPSAVKGSAAFQANSQWDPNDAHGDASLETHEQVFGTVCSTCINIRVESQLIQNRILVKSLIDKRFVVAKLLGCDIRRFVPVRCFARTG